MQEMRWSKHLRQAVRQAQETGKEVQGVIFRGFSQRGMPYAKDVGLLREQVSGGGAILWYGVADGRLHWMVQPLDEEAGAAFGEEA